MRRQEREVTESSKIQHIIMECHCCRLGLYDESAGEVYIVPLNFGYEEMDGKRIFYFHGAKEGRKISLLKKVPSVGFELDANYALVEGTKACQYTAEYQSVIGTGTVSFIETNEDKKHALNTIMHHTTGKGEWEFSDQSLERVCVFKLEVKTIACKQHH